MAAVEPAFVGCGQKEGIEIWRIVNFEVVAWDKDRYGEFFDGDSFIVLKTNQEKDGELEYDLHFWIGQKSTQDEYGTVAIKSVELDQYLGDKPVQYREIQGCESKLFKSYFPKLIIKSGGADSGFKKVEKEEFKPRLMRIRGDRKKMEIFEVPCKRSNLDSGDIFILDLGDDVHQWNGAKANLAEKNSAREFVQELKDLRNGRVKFEMHDETDMRPGDEFYDRCFPLTGPREMPEDAKMSTVKSLYRVSDAAGGQPKFTKEKEGKIVRGDFDSKDVFIFDAIHTVYVFKGKECSLAERLGGLKYGEQYIKDNELKHVHLCVLAEGKENHGDFLTSLDK